MTSSRPEPAPEYCYDLPSELIAREPTSQRVDSRLLLTSAHDDQIDELRFRELGTVLRDGDVLVINDTRVLSARLYARRRPSGGRVELLLLEPRDDGVWSALARPARKLKPGDRLDLEARDGALVDGALAVVTVGEQGEVSVAGAQDSLEHLMEAHGHMPVPPYIVAARREDGLTAEQSLDQRRYQTVYAQIAGSVAAPTAGLHFDDDLLDDLRNRGVRVVSVTLHVNIGTFRNPDERDLRENRLHEERIIYSAETDRILNEARVAGGRVIAVGTTSLRVLETVARLALPQDAAMDDELGFGENEDRPEFRGRALRRAAGWDVEGATHLFVRPPDWIRGADALITNFHLPESSLLMLVASAMGGERWRLVYDEAVRRECRFYSYGDAMMIAPLAGRNREGADA